MANHSYTTYTHNSLGAIAQMYNRKYTNNALVSSHTGYGATDIGYDNLGNPSDFSRGGTLAGWKYHNFTAERNTLIEEYIEQTGDWFGFEHDNALNVTTMRGSGLPSYNWDNQFTYQQNYLDHDGDGNATRHFGASLAYDHENQLTSSSQGGTVTYGYDGDGLRAWKQIGSGARTYYLYDGEILMGELTPTGTLSAINTWGANGLVARWTPAGVTYYMYDNLGNVSDRLNASQTIVSSDLYDAYGQRQIGTSTDPYGYKGQVGYYTDRETGLILCTYRYYDPDSGGWLTRDPIGYAGGNNLYGYVGGNPVSWADPSGLMAAPQLPNGLPAPPPWPLPPGKSGNINWWEIAESGTGADRTKWGPGETVPTDKGGQPSASWEEGGKHWDIDDGKGTRSRCDRWGRKLTEAQAHWRARRPPPPLGPLLRIVGKVIVNIVTRPMVLLIFPGEIRKHTFPGPQIPA